MIKGIGVDVVEIDRLGGVIDKWGDRFLSKIFTPVEIGYAMSRKNATHHYAARFAVKEAVAKAVSLGWSGAFRWKDVEVENDPSGKPRVRLNGALGRLLQGTSVHVSISHSENVVVGMVIVEE